MMYCLNVFIILWSCNIVFDASVTAAVRGDINVYESKQKYCGALLERSIEVFCIDIPRRLQFLESQKTQRNTRDTGRKSKIARVKHRFLINHCCVQECSLNFIKSNCPGTHKRHQKKNTGVVQKPSTTKTNTTAKPGNKKSRFRKKNKTRTTNLPTTTTTTTSLPTTTTTTTRRPTTTTTTTTEYYYDDMYYFKLPSS